jgi:hypothetical protein
MKVTFYTDKFLNSHGKLPKGFGCWAFKATYVHIGKGELDYIDHVQEDMFLAYGTLAEAKKTAKAFYSMIPHAKGAMAWVDILP